MKDTLEAELQAARNAFAENGFLSRLIDNIGGRKGSFQEGDGGEKASVHIFAIQRWHIVKNSTKKNDYRYQ